MRAAGRALICLWLLYVVIFFWTGERIPVNDGAGWDGHYYTLVARDFTDSVVNRNITPTIAQRILPSAIVAASLNLTGADSSIQNIQIAYWAMGVIMILLSLAMWARISETLKFADGLRTLGICALLVVFPMTKMFVYNPILTDVSAFFIGMLAVFGFVRNSLFFIWMAFFGALFTWPSGVVSLPFLIIFSLDQRLHGWGVAVRPTQSYVFLFSVIIFWTALCVYLIKFKWLTDGVPLYLPLSDRPSLFYVTVIIGSIIGAVTTHFTFRWVSEVSWTAVPAFFVKNVRLTALTGVAIVVVLWIVWLSTFKHPSFAPTVFSFFLNNVFRHQLFQPGAFPLYLINFFGPMILLVIYYWADVTKIVLNWGPGIWLFFLSQLIFAMDPEARHALLLYPFLVTIVVKAMNDRDYRISLPYLSVFLGISILSSRVWYEINTPEFVSTILPSAPTADPIHQRYHMMFGIFTDYGHYFIQGSFVISIGFAFLFFHHRLQSRKARTKAVA